MTEEERITLNGGGRAIQRLVVATTLLVAGAAFIMGVPALVSAGTAAGLSLAAWLAPIVVDGGLTVSGLAAAVRRSQGRRAPVETGLMAGLTVLSMAVQAIHAWSTTATSVAAFAAAAVAAVAPLAVLASTHIALHAVLAEPTKGKRRPAAAAAAAAAATGKTPIRPTTAKARTSRPLTASGIEPLTKLIPLVRAGELSRRRAAERAGVSRHRVDAALHEAA